MPILLTNIHPFVLVRLKLDVIQTQTDCPRVNFSASWRTSQVAAIARRWGGQPLIVWSKVLREICYLLWGVPQHLDKHLKSNSLFFRYVKSERLLRLGNTRAEIDFSLIVSYAVWHSFTHSRLKEVVYPSSLGNHRVVSL